MTNPRILQGLADAHNEDLRQAAAIARVRGDRHNRRWRPRHLLHAARTWSTGRRAHPGPEWRRTATTRWP